MDGVAWLHEQGFCHLDIKPENVVIHVSSSCLIDINPYFQFRTSMVVCVIYIAARFILGQNARIAVFLPSQAD